MVSAFFFSGFLLAVAEESGFSGGETFLTVFPGLAPDVVFFFVSAESFLGFSTDGTAALLADFFLTEESVAVFLMTGLTDLLTVSFLFLI